LTKSKKNLPGDAVKGEGKIFYSAEEVVIAVNEKSVDLHAQIKIKITNALEGTELKTKIIETTAGRVLFNMVVPHEVGYINELLTKKSLRDIIGMIVKKTGMAKTAKFLDDIKALGFMTAFKGGLSFNLGDIQTPVEKMKIIDEAQVQVDEVISNYNVATFIKEFIVRLPEGESLDFQAGGYIQIDVPAFKTDFKDFDITPSPEDPSGPDKYKEDWDKFNLWDLTLDSKEPIFRAYSMANHPAEGNRVMLNVRIATPPPNMPGIKPGRLLRVFCRG
jgi:hypothetical protein